ncbi:MAG: DsrE family protein [Candidatus Azotimanducaceae bacterium WSBS_2022_MAG_OTU7]
MCSRPPHGSINAQEGLDALLMGAATQCSVLFLGGGLMQLIKGLRCPTSWAPEFSLGFGALKDYGVARIACSKPDLIGYGLSRDDF